jgi:hypothetical protein
MTHVLNPALLSYRRRGNARVKPEKQRSDGGKERHRQGVPFKHVGLGFQSNSAHILAGRLLGSRKAR